MNIRKENLIFLEQWKNQKRDENFSDYLKLLSFDNLINESNKLMSKIKRRDHDDDFFSRTCVMMNEFSNRLEKESKHLAESTENLKKQIEKKLH